MVSATLFLVSILFASSQPNLPPSRCPDIKCHVEEGASCLPSLEPFTQDLCAFPALTCSRPAPNTSNLPPLPSPLPPPPECLYKGETCEAKQPGSSKCGCDNDCSHPTLNLYCQNGLCQIFKQPGDYCKSFSDCSSGSRTACQRNRCAADTLPGGICLRDVQCVASSYCNDTALLDKRPPTCQPRPNVGQPCSATHPCRWPQAACNLAAGRGEGVCQEVYSLPVGTAVIQFPPGPPSLCSSGFVHNGTCQAFPAATNPYAPCSAKLMCTTDYTGPGIYYFGTCSCSAESSQNMPYCSNYPTGNPQELVASQAIQHSFLSLVLCGVQNNCWMNELWKSLKTAGSCLLTNCKDQSVGYSCQYYSALYLLCLAEPAGRRSQTCRCQDTKQLVQDACGYIPSMSPSPSFSRSPTASSDSLSSSPAMDTPASTSLWEDYGVYVEVVAASAAGFALLLLVYCCCLRRPRDPTAHDEYWPTDQLASDPAVLADLDRASRTEQTGQEHEAARPLRASKPQQVEPLLQDAQLSPASERITGGRRSSRGSRGSRGYRGRRTFHADDLLSSGDFEMAGN